MAFFYAEPALLISNSTNLLARGYWDPEVGADEDSVPEYSNDYDDEVFNWYAATAGSGSKNMSSSAIAQDSVCPNGWQMPENKHSSTVSWYNLVLNEGATFLDSNRSSDGEVLLRFPVSMRYTKRPPYEPKTAVAPLYLWSSTSYDAGHAYHFGLDTNKLIGVSHYNPESLLFFVRCLKPGQ